MKKFMFILALLISTQFVAKSNNSNLDTVYLKDRQAWFFYGDYQYSINKSRRHNLQVLTDNDPKYRDAFYIIDKLVDNNVNPECVRKPLMDIGVNPSLIPRYKLHFLQQLTGKYYPPGVKNAIDSRAPDNLMFVVNKITKMLVYTRCTNFQDSDNQAMNLQIVDKEVLSIAQIHMDDIKRFGGYVYKSK